MSIQYRPVGPRGSWKVVLSSLPGGGAALLRLSYRLSKMLTRILWGTTIFSRSCELGGLGAIRGHFDFLGPSWLVNVVLTVNGDDAFGATTGW